ncbi:hypothetical protein BLL42_28075 (plasmid) [Pseudomonas frederiksbergensis]|uniref:Uncharacterized protein n=1 Tax=Pseudomonas frederiksbergensis TaxID=104087 RepID=A0A1J0EUA3_9PSED|nr:hypothetical protein BLL42_28075 [Pseudomonas frederiksbergensis]
MALARPKRRLQSISRPETVWKYCKRAASVRKLLRGVAIIEVALRRQKRPLSSVLNGRDGWGISGRELQGCIQRTLLNLRPLAELGGVHIVILRGRFFMHFRQVFIQ